MHPQKQSPAAAKLLQLDRPVIIGHRGYCHFAPENTIPSFELAIAAGVDSVEMDCRKSGDGHLVVIHDREFDRTTDAHRRWLKPRNRVSSRTLAEIQGLDAGAWFHPNYLGTRIPLLSQALECVRHRTVALVERKDGEARLYATVLKSLHRTEDVIVQSFDWHFLKELHELMPELTLGALGPPVFLADGRRPAALIRQFTGSWAAQAQKCGAKVVVWSRWVTRRGAAEAADRNLKIWCYTINRPELAARLLKRGVSGLITDNPSLIWRAVALTRPHPPLANTGKRRRWLGLKRPFLRRPKPQA